MAAKKVVLMAQWSVDCLELLMVVSTVGKMEYSSVAHLAGN